jgi:hypothetical protein
MNDEGRPLCPASRRTLGFPAVRHNHHAGSVEGFFSREDGSTTPLPAMCASVPKVSDVRRDDHEVSRFPLYCWGFSTFVAFDAIRQ